MTTTSFEDLCALLPAFSTCMNHAASRAPQTVFLEAFRLARSFLVQLSLECMLGAVLDFEICHICSKHLDGWK